MISIISNLLGLAKWGQPHFLGFDIFYGKNFDK